MSAPTPTAEIKSAAALSFTFTNSPFEVELVDKLGSDLTVVNSARISFGSRHQKLTKGDEKLINFLAHEKHYSPFRHCMLQLRIKAPEFVLRQAYKHAVGIEATSTYATKDHAWNEISGRYKPYNEIYVPPEWYVQHKTAKQCSAGPHVDQERIGSIYMEGIQANLATYEKLLEEGISKEQARMLLPLTFMTEVVWTTSLQAIQNFVVLRDSEHAQKEIRQLAQEVRRIAEETFPVAFKALMDSEK